MASFELHRAVNDQEQFYKDIGLEEREELEEMEGGAEIALSAALGALCTAVVRRTCELQSKGQQHPSILWRVLQGM